MPKLTIKGLQAQLEDRRKSHQESEASFSDFKAQVRAAIGGSGYLSESDLAKKIADLAQYRAMTEGTESVSLSVLREELDRVWHLVRLLSGDKLLGNPSPSYKERYSAPLIIDGKAVEPSVPAIDTFNRPSGNRDRF